MTLRRRVRWSPRVKDARPGDTRLHFDSSSLERDQRLQRRTHVTLRELDSCHGSARRLEQHQPGPTALGLLVTLERRPCALAVGLDDPRREHPLDLAADGGIEAE